MTGLDLIKASLEHTGTIRPHEIEKTIKTIKMLSALRKPCKIKDLTELTGWKTITVRLALSKNSAIISKEKTKPEVYQLAAYKESSS